ncbi:MAG TPA: hypothetical protein VGZ01_12870 [Trinickia sp.]|nr:hypothetical protein [Trinickia sp.]
MRARRFNSPIRRVGEIVVFIALSMALLAATARNSRADDDARVDAGASRTPTVARHLPPGVPQGYVVTPFGYSHLSCVRAVAAGETLLADGRIQAADGRVQPSPACGHPRYRPDGIRIDPSAWPGDAVYDKRGHAPSANGWLEASWYHGSAPFGGVNAKWLVPSPPASDVGQVLYYFPGLEDYEHVVTILQPVLAWNGFNDHAWSIASWNCCISGNVNYSYPVAVATGDMIAGAITGDCPAAQVCSRWDIVTADTTRATQSVLRRTSNNGQRFDWAFAGVLEVYGVGACSQYSSNGFVDFTNVVLDDVGDKPIAHVPWAPSGLMVPNPPTCNYGVSVTPTSASLTF